MANKKQSLQKPALLLKNTETGQTFGVVPASYKRLIRRPEWVDGGSSEELLEKIGLGEEEAQAASDLPEDFPGRSSFVKDGRYVTLDAVREASDADLDDVGGIGKATIEDIRAYLDQDAQRSK